MNGRTATKRSTNGNDNREAQARDLIDKINALRATIPDFELSHPAQVKTIRAVAAVPNEFLLAAVAAVESSDGLKSATGFTIDDARDTVAFTQAFEGVADVLEQFAKGVRHTIAIKRAKVAQEALQVYDVSKGMVRNSESAALKPYINEMKVSLRRNNGRRARARKNPTPAPAQS